jgi:hypothetical protein
MSHIDDNAAARERILTMVAPLSDAEMAVEFEGGWTIGAELGHLAFWDRVHVGRLRAALEAGGDLPARLPEGATDALNNAGLYQWRLIGGAVAARLFGEASAEADAYIATIDPAVVERIRAAGLERQVERFRHRTDHGDAIEQAIRDR